MTNFIIKTSETQNIGKLMNTLEGLIGGCVLSPFPDIMTSNSSLLKECTDSDKLEFMMVSKALITFLKEHTC